MAKYDALRRFLAAHTEAEVRVSFEELDAVVGGLPRSARIHRRWWENGTSIPHPQTRGWLDAGFRVEAVDLERGVVRFSRNG
jgi:hypothetical protein